MLALMDINEFESARAAYLREHPIEPGQLLRWTGTPTQVAGLLGSLATAGGGSIEGAPTIAGPPGFCGMLGGVLVFEADEGGGFSVARWGEPEQEPRDELTVEYDHEQEIRDPSRGGRVKLRDVELVTFDARLISGADAKVQARAALRRVGWSAAMPDAELRALLREVTAEGRRIPRVVFEPLSLDRADGRGGFNDPETGTWIPCVTEGQPGDSLCVIDSAALGALGEADAALVHQFAAVAGAQDALATAARAVERVAALGELNMLREVAGASLALLTTFLHRGSGMEDTGADPVALSASAELRPGLGE